MLRFGASNWSASFSFQAASLRRRRSTPRTKQRRRFGARWMEFKAEHLFYFNRVTISRELANARLGAITLHRGVKRLSFDYVSAHFEKYPIAGLTHALRGLRALLPARLRERPVSIVASGLIVLARSDDWPETMM